MKGACEAYLRRREEPDSAYGENQTHNWKQKTFNLSCSMYGRSIVRVDMLGTRRVLEDLHRCLARCPRSTHGAVGWQPAVGLQRARRVSGRKTQQTRAEADDGRLRG